MVVDSFLSASSWFRRLSVILIAVVVVNIVWVAMAYQFPPIESQTYLALLYKAEILQLDPNGLYNEFLSKTTTWITYIQKEIASILKLQTGRQLAYLDLVHIGLYLLLFFPLLIWSYRVVAIKKENRLFLFIVLVIVFCKFINTVYSFSYWKISFLYHDFQLGVSSQSLFFLAFISWLLFDSLLYRIIAYASLFFLGLFHPVGAALAAMFIFLWHFDAVFFDSHNHTDSRILGWKEKWLPFLIISLCLIPILPTVLSMGGNDVPQISSEQYFKLLAFSNPRHLFPWRDPITLTYFISISLSVMIFTHSDFSNWLGKKNIRKLRIAFYASFILCILTIVLMEFFHFPKLGGDKIILRVFTVIDFLFALLYGTLLVQSLEKDDKPFFIVLFVGLLFFFLGKFTIVNVVFFPICIFFRRFFRNHHTLWILFSILLISFPYKLFPHTEVFSNRKIILYVILYLGIVGLAMFLNYAKLKTDNKWIHLSFIWRNLFNLFLVFSIYTLICNIKSEKVKNNRSETGICRYIRLQTERDATILTPFDFTQYVTPTSIERDIVIDRQVWDTFNYNFRIFPKVREAFRIVYNIDINELAIKGRNIKDINFDEMLNDIYLRFTPEKIDTIQSAFPRIKYMVYPVNSNSKNRFASHRNLKRVYSDEYFELYKYCSPL